MYIYKIVRDNQYDAGTRDQFKVLVINTFKLRWWESYRHNWELLYLKFTQKIKTFVTESMLQSDLEYTVLKASKYLLYLQRR